jgi:hypothetical protein
MVTTLAKKSAPAPEAPAPALRLDKLFVGDGYNGPVGQVSVVFVCDPPAAYLDATKTVHREILAARKVVQEAFRDHVAFAKIGQFAAQQREARKLQAEARGREQDAGGAARAAIRSLGDPRPHEEAGRAAADDARVYGLRVEMLDSFIAEARTEAQRELSKLIHDCQDGLETKAREALAEITARVVAALAPLLPELHAATARCACFVHPGRAMVLGGDAAKVFELPGG